jgi:hypothetical protein
MKQNRAEWRCTIRVLTSVPFVVVREKPPSTFSLVGYLNRFLAVAGVAGPDGFVPSDLGARRVAPTGFVRELGKRVSNQGLTQGCESPRT